MYYSAKNPDRVRDKLWECHTFLVQMTERELASDPEGLMRTLGAFLGSFRSAVNRLYGVTETKLGPTAKVSLITKLHEHPDIGLLIDRSNEEAHGDGSVVWRISTVHGVDAILCPAPGWRFPERDKNLIELCFDGLRAMECFAGQVLNAVPGDSIRSHAQGEQTPGQTRSSEIPCP